MPTNFEKEVQQKMEEMSLSPSAPVWEKIELEIRPEKKRRRLFFWLFIGLLIAGTGWLIATTASKKSSSLSLNNTRQHMVVDTVVKPHPTLVTTDTLSNRITQNRKIIVAVSIKKETDPALVNINKTQPDNHNLKDFSTEKLVPANTDGAAITNQFNINDKDKKSVINKTAKLPNGNHQPALNGSTSIAEKPLPATDSAKVQRKNKDSVIKSKEDSIPAKVKLAKRKTNWKNYVVFNLGKSQYTGGYQQTSSPLQFTASSTSNPQNSNVAPSPSHSGLSFSIGYGITKTISKKVTLSIGLQYAYYSVNNVVGSLQNTNRIVLFNADTTRINQYYTSSSQQNFMNKFGTIELPLSLQYGLSKKLSITLGGSYARLLKSTALTYDYTSGTWYFNKQNNKRNGLSLLAAVQYRFYTRGRLGIASGPSVQYNLLRIQNDNKYPTPRLFSAGVKTTILF